MSLSARLSGQTTESDLSDIWQGAPPSASDGWAAGFRIDRPAVAGASPKREHHELGLAARRRVGVCIHRSLAMTIRRGSVSYVDAGDARGWNVWPLENGEWAWNAWIASNLGTPQSGIEATEHQAEEAAQRALEHNLSEARAAAQHRRQLPLRDERGVPWEPRADTGVQSHMTQACLPLRSICNSWSRQTARNW